VRAVNGVAETMVETRWVLTVDVVELASDRSELLWGVLVRSRPPLRPVDKVLLELRVSTRSRQHDRVRSSRYGPEFTRARTAPRTFVPFETGIAGAEMTARATADIAAAGETAERPESLSSRQH
jgi:hypothetical protein